MHFGKIADTLQYARGVMSVIQAYREGFQQITEKYLKQVHVRYMLVKFE